MHLIKPKSLIINIVVNVCTHDSFAAITKHVFNYTTASGKVLLNLKESQWKEVLVYEKNVLSNDVSDLENTSEVSNIAAISRIIPSPII